MTYLDHAATTPMRPEVREVLTEHLGITGNASSAHAAGRRARRIIEESRERIAAAIGCRPGEIVFTSGGTEADNLAVQGITAGIREARCVAPDAVGVVSTPVEHHAVLDPLHQLSLDGTPVRYAPVDGIGRVDAEAFADLVAAPDVALASVMWANNEVGTTQPIHRLAEIAHDHGVLFHTDAVQAIGQVPVDVEASGVDALSLTAHKLGGPLGVGALVVRRDVPVAPLLHGGGHERDLRPGTQDMPAIAGFAVAVELAVAAQAAEASRLSALRDELVRRVREVVPDVIYNGDPRSGPSHRLPGNAHLTFPGCEGDSLLMLLDAKGIECSTGSACQAGVPEPSHVLLAMGCDTDAARSSLRFTLGHTSTEGDVDALVAEIGGVVERARVAGSLGAVSPSYFSVAGRSSAGRPVPTRSVPTRSVPTRSVPARGAWCASSPR